MLGSLIESGRATRCRGALGGGSASLLLHSALITGAVYATLHAREIARAERFIVPIAFPTQKEPPPPPRGVPQVVGVELRGFRMLRLPTSIPTAIPAPNPAATFDPRDWLGIGLENGTALGRDTIAAPVINPGSVYSTDVVEERRERVGGPQPSYPERLRQAGIGGQTTVECVVDTTGHAEPGSIRIISSSNSLFDRPAREAIAASLFRPGRLAGRPGRVEAQAPLTSQAALRAGRP